jgi:hypothetical protein
MNPCKEPLFQSCYGQATVCLDSGGYWLDFGETQIWLCHERLRQLARKLNQLVNVSERPHEQAFSQQLMVCLPDSYDTVSVFSFDELLDLQALVNGSLAMVDLYDFLHDNQLQIDS